MRLLVFVGLLLFAWSHVAASESEDEPQFVFDCTFAERVHKEVHTFMKESVPKLCEVTDFLKGVSKESCKKNVEYYTQNNRLEDFADFIQNVLVYETNRQKLNCDYARDIDVKGTEVICPHLVAYYALAQGADSLFGDVCSTAPKGVRKSCKSALSDDTATFIQHNIPRLAEALELKCDGFDNLEETAKAMDHSCEFVENFRNHIKEAVTSLGKLCEFASADYQFQCTAGLEIFRPKIEGNMLKYTDKLTEFLNLTCSSDIDENTEAKEEL